MPSGAKTNFHRTTIGHGTASTSDDSAPSLALTILYHPRLDRIGDRVVLSDLSRPLALSRAEPLFSPPGASKGEPLGDEHLSRKPICISSDPDGGARLDCGECSTAVNVFGERITGGRSFTASDVARGVVIELGHRVVLLLHRMGSLEGILDGDEPDAERELVGSSDGLRRVLWDVGNVADLDLPVLLRGETGSGKELVARAIHKASPRRDKPYITVNLGAISPSLAISELFGAEKGAYTGSIKRHLGYFEQAHGGTLFLDEIGEAPVELQVALLRTLETGEIQTVGAPQLRKIDVRVIAATDADLEGKVAAGSFRAPLLNRLSAFEIWIPPLRERREDIGRLFARFLREELGEIGESHRLAPSYGDGKPWIPASLVARLADYDWPGNVRQLRNIARQLVIGNRGRSRADITPAIERLLAASPQGASASRPPAERSLDVAKNPVTEAPPAPADESVTVPRVTSRRRPSDVTEAELREALRASRWDLAAAAEKLGISRASMYLLNERFSWFRTAGDLTEEEIRRSHRECEGDLAKMSERLEVSERALGRRVRELGLA